MPTTIRRTALAASSALLLVLGACAAPAPAPASGPEANAAFCDVQVDPSLLVDVRSLDPSIRTEVRYATADNFTGAPLPGYEVPRVLLRPEAARSLARVQASLRDEGLGLKLFDGYRPVRATLAMVDWAESSGNDWVLEEGYVARRSGHNLAAAIDLTLVDLATGEALEMGTPWDTFSEDAHTANATGQVRENRMRLLRAMEAEGWENFEKEWWHYSLPGEREPLDAPLGCFG